jgi:hypothetical protein
VRAYPSIQAHDAVCLRDMAEHLQHVQPRALGALHLQSDLEERERMSLYRYTCRSTFTAKLLVLNHFNALPKLTQIQRMRKARRSATRAPSKPKRIVNRLLPHILALQHFCCAHLLLESRHDSLARFDLHRSCM